MNSVIFDIKKKPPFTDQCAIEMFRSTLAFFFFLFPFIFFLFVFQDLFLQAFSGAEIPGQEKALMWVWELNALAELCSHQSDVGKSVFGADALKIQRGVSSLDLPVSARRGSAPFLPMEVL